MGNLKGTVEIAGTIKGSLSPTREIKGSLTIPRGDGGNIDYEKRIINKPSIEGHELIGDKSFKQLGMDTLSVQEIEKILYFD